jgi:hypothetical protein
LRGLFHGTVCTGCGAVGLARGGRAEQDGRMTPAPRSDLFTFAAVQFVTILFAGLAVWLVLTQGIGDLPIMDEWDLLSEYTFAGKSSAWYLMHHCEHRYPVGKFAWIHLLQLSGFNFKVPMLATVGLLAASALLLQWTARGLRGRSSAWDVLYPAVLLHWGHAFNLTMSYQLGFALVTYGLCGWAWAGRWFDATRKPVWLVIAVFYLLLMCSGGGFGLALTPAVVGWLLAVAWSSFRRKQFINGSIATFSAIGLFAYAVWCYRTMPPMMGIARVAPWANPLEFLHAVQSFLASAFDANVSMPHPLRPWLALCVFWLVVLLAVRRWRTVRTEWPTAIWVLFGVLCVGGAMAYARGSMVAERYAMIAAPAACVLLILTTLKLHPRWWHWPVALAMAGGLWWWNFDEGLRHAMRIRLPLQKMSQHIRDGMTPLELAGRYGNSGSIVVGGRIEWEFPLLKSLGLPVFQQLKDTPPYRLEPFTMWPKQHTSAAPAAFPDPPPTATGLRLVLIRTKAPAVDYAHFRWIAPTDQTHEAVAHLHMILEHNMTMISFQPGSKNVSLELIGLTGELTILEAAWVCPP